MGAHNGRLSDAAREKPVGRPVYVQRREANEAKFPAWENWAAVRPYDGSQRMPSPLPSPRKRIRVRFCLRLSALIVSCKRRRESRCAYRRKRVVDPRRPTILLERHQHGLLIRRGELELLDDVGAHPQLPSLLVPLRTARHFIGSADPANSDTRLTRSGYGVGRADLARHGDSGARQHDTRRLGEQQERRAAEVPSSVVGSRRLDGVFDIALGGQPAQVAVGQLGKRRTESSTARSQVSCSNSTE